MQFSNVLMVIAVIAVALAVFNLGAVVLTQQTQTGFASSDIGNTSLAVLSSISINFTQKDTLYWGSGAVNSAFENAILNSEGVITQAATGFNWTQQTSGLNLTNDGNVNVNLTLVADKDAAGFIGGTTTLNGPRFQWKLNQADVGACTGVINALNPTVYTNVTCSDGAGTACINDAIPLKACSTFVQGKRIEIDVQIEVPLNVLPGPKQSLITATADPNTG